ncbi:MAG: 2Fe-2S iron-sulfur cluster-binding protein [Lysobacterales bacterium]
MHLSVNGKAYEVDVDDNMPLLWVLRDELSLTGTKYGCGIGVCGSCSVMIDGTPVRSCLYRVMDVSGEITTIEGIGTPENLHPVQASWIEEQVPQCGYCQSGQIIAAVSLLEDVAVPDDKEIDRVFSDYLCRCGTYSRIRAAVHAATAQVIEIKSTTNGIKIVKAYAAVDFGYALDPRNIISQVEGSLLYGLTAAIMGEITVNDGVVDQLNFHEYGMLHMSDSPPVEVKIIESKESIYGAGESGLSGIAPALGNAIFALTGQRFRELPFRQFIDFT